MKKKIKRIGLWGTGEAGKKIVEHLKIENDLTSVYDRKAENVSIIYSFMGVQVYPPSEIDLSLDCLIIASMYYPEIVAQAVELGFPANKTQVWYYDRLLDRTVQIDTAEIIRMLPKYKKAFLLRTQALQTVSKVKKRFKDKLEQLGYSFNIAQQPGLILEFGVFTGRSINHIASLTKEKVYGFDTFEGLPEKWKNTHPAGTFAVSRLPKVPDNVELIKGRFEETLNTFLETHTEPISFAHLDADLYSATVFVLHQIANRLRPGTVLVFDEFIPSPDDLTGGEFQAWSEFVSSKSVKYNFISCSGESVGLQIISINV